MTKFFRVSLNPSTAKGILIFSFVIYVVSSSIFDARNTSLTFETLAIEPLKKFAVYKKDSKNGELLLISESDNSNLLNSLTECLKQIEKAPHFREDKIENVYFVKFFNAKFVHEIQVFHYENGYAALGGYYKVININTDEKESFNNLRKKSKCLMKHILSLSEGLPG